MAHHSIKHNSVKTMEEGYSKEHCRHPVLLELSKDISFLHILGVYLQKIGVQLCLLPRKHFIRH